MILHFGKLPNAHTGEKQRRQAVIADLARERAKRRSKNVNGNRGDVPGTQTTIWDVCVIGFAWAALLGFVTFAVIATIRAI